MNENLNIGGFIAGRRKALGLTQRQLAERLNVTDKAVSKWERGQGYPDITMLATLAGTLGVTVGQLLQGGEEEETPAPEGAPEEGQVPTVLPQDAVVQKALRYGGQVARAARNSAAGVTAAVVSILCLVAIATCLIVDFAINGQVTWAAIPVASVVFGWAALMPLLRLGKHRVAAALGVVTLLVLPLLWFIAYSSGGSWFAPVALPTALLGLGGAWALVLILCYTRLNVWLKTSFIFFVVLVIDFGSDVILERASLYPFDADTLISALAAGLLAAVFLVIGLAKAKKKQ